MAADSVNAKVEQYREVLSAAQQVKIKEEEEEYIFKPRKLFNDER